MVLMTVPMLVCLSTWCANESLLGRAIASAELLLVAVAVPSSSELYEVSAPSRLLMIVPYACRSALPRTGAGSAVGSEAEVGLDAIGCGVGLGAGGMDVMGVVASGVGVGVAVCSGSGVGGIVGVGVSVVGPWRRPSVGGMNPGVVGPVGDDVGARAGLVSVIDVALVGVVVGVVAGIALFVSSVLSVETCLVSDLSARLSLGCV